MKEEQKKYKHWSWICCDGHKKGNSSLLWGLFFLAIAGFALAREMGYIPFDISTWIILLGAFGLFLTARGISK